MDSGAHQYVHRSPRGTFVIGRDKLGWWVQLNTVMLGSGFATAQHALDDLLSGSTDWPYPDVDPAALGIPSEMADWRAVG